MTHVLAKAFNTMHGPIQSPETVSFKVHKNENFFGSDFEFCTISWLIMQKY